MSATNFSFATGSQKASTFHVPRPLTWWRTFVPRCANALCPHRNKLWPSRVRRNSGVFFDAGWFCEVSCLQAVLDSRVRNLLPAFVAPKAKTHRMPLGLLLVEQHAISTSQLREALRLQRESCNGRLGDLFLRSGSITEEQLTSALAQQWGCPVFPLADEPLPVSSPTPVPVAVLESAFAVPAHASLDGRTLHLAFAERPDHTLLYAVEQLLNCRTVACMAPHSAVAQRLARLRSAERSEIFFDTMRDPLEIASTICSYAQELRAAHIALARTTSHVWVRFSRHDANRDLLFRILPEPCSTLRHPSSASAGKVFCIPADNGKDGVSNAALPL